MYFLNANQSSRRFLDDLRFARPPCWDQTTAGDEKVLRLFRHCCCRAQMCKLCWNRLPSACLAEIKTFTNSDLSHCEAMTSLIPQFGPCHLVTLVEPITNGWRHTMTSQFRKLMSTCTRAPRTFIACQAQPCRSCCSRKRKEVAARVLACCWSEKSTFFSKQQTHWSRVEEFMGWSSVPVTR